MTFKHLDIGSRFDFDHTGLTTWSGAVGPWFKLSARKYQHESGGPAHRVGTVNVDVLVLETTHALFTDSCGHAGGPWDKFSTTMDRVTCERCKRNHQEAR